MQEMEKDLMELIDKMSPDQLKIALKAEISHDLESFSALIKEDKLLIEYMITRALYGLSRQALKRKPAATETAKETL